MKKRFAFIIIIIFIFSALLFTKSITATSTIPYGTTIADIPVTGKTEKEIKRLLETEISSWQTRDDIILKSDLEYFALPRSVFQFDIEATIKELTKKTKKNFFSTLKRQKSIQIPIVVYIDEEYDAVTSITELDYINKEKMMSRLNEMASELNDHDIFIPYEEGKDIPLATIVNEEIEIPAMSNAVLTYAVNQLNEHLIHSNESFSFLETITFPEHLVTSTEEVSFLATALYTAFLQTNVEVIKRYAHPTAVTYADAGKDVLINDKENKDLIVMNPNPVALVINANLENGKLYITIKSMPMEFTYKERITRTKEIKPRTLYRYSQKLKHGEQHIIQQGNDGLVVEVQRDRYAKNSTFIDSELISKDVYLPTPKIILVSTTEVVPDDRLDSQSEEDEAEIEDKIGELEERMNDLNISLYDKNEETISEFKDQLGKLQENLIKMEEKFNLSNVMMEEDIKEQQQELNKKFEQLKEQYDTLMAYLLEVFPTEQVEGGKVSD